MILTSLGEWITDFFTTIGDKISWTSIITFLAGLISGVIICSCFYGILIIISVRNDKRFKVKTDVVNDDELENKILKEVEEIKKRYIDDTAGFSASEKMKVLANALLETATSVASNYYPESKYPLYEITFDELLQFMHYISNRVEAIFDKRILRPFKYLSISKIFLFMDSKKRIEETKVVKAASKLHVGKFARTFLNIANYANPFYWIRVLFTGGTVGFAFNRIALIIIDIVADETNKTYSKRLFNQSKSLNSDEVDLDQAIIDIIEENE